MSVGPQQGCCKWNVPKSVPERFARYLQEVSGGHCCEYLSVKDHRIRRAQGRDGFRLLAPCPRHPLDHDLRTPLIAEEQVSHLVGVERREDDAMADSLVSRFGCYTTLWDTTPVGRVVCTVQLGEAKRIKMQ